MIKEDKEEIKKEGKEEFKHRIRLGGTVLDGNRDVVRALTQIKGIGRQVSTSLVRSLNFDGRRKLGSLSDSEIEKLEEKIQNLAQVLPSWMRNRRRDYVTGKDLHLIGTEIELAPREDIKRQKVIKSYRGIRHSAGLPVRGQRTRTSFRKGTTVGVVRKKALQKGKKSVEKEGGGKR